MRTRRELLAKATVTTADVTFGLLAAEQSRAFIRKIKDSEPLLSRVTTDIKGASSGQIDKIATGARIIRGAPENADDGYRVGATFAQVGYVTKKVRLPWEVTEDVFHENIEGAELEATLTDEMTQQFGLDIADLGLNGDTAAGAGPDQAFLQIDDGWLKQIVTANVAGRRINGAAINGGAIAKEHFFTAYRAMPRVYRRKGGLVWLANGNTITDWWEYLTNRTGAQGDQLLGGQNPVANAPMGIPWLECPAMPDSRMLLLNPKNLHYVVSWQVRKRRVTGETDATLAAKDKRFYIFFLKQDYIIEETDAVVDVYGLV